MMKPLSNLLQEISPSATLEISARAKQLKQSGEDIIDLSIGEPDFQTPEKIRNTAIERIRFGNNGYTASAGLLDLKIAICEKLKEDNALEYRPEQIVVSNGAKQSLYNACMAILNPGDEVLLPTPCWVSYVEMVKLAGAIPVEVPTTYENNFTPAVSELEAVVTKNTKAIILNSPNNPTGSVMDKEALIAIGHFAVAHDLYIISDEIYEKIIYNKAHHSIAALSPAFYQRTITVNGMSKAYSMTGWRIGYSASNDTIAKLMTNLQSHSTSAPNTVAQYASIKGLQNVMVDVEFMRAEFEQRRDFLIRELAQFPGFRFRVPDGAFYFFIDVSGYFGKTFADTTIENAKDFAAFLLETCKVAVIPGEAFGPNNFIRISYATSTQNLETFVQRLKDAGLNEC